MFDSFSLQIPMLNTMLLPGIILVVSFIAGHFLNSYLLQYISKHKELSPNAPFSVLLNSIRGLPRIWCVAIGVYWTIHTISLVDSIRSALSCILFTIIVFSVTRVTARVFDQLIEINTADAIRDPANSSLLTNLVTTAIYACGVVFVLDYYEISVAPIITALGIGGMAIALGLQEMLANIFAGMHLLLSKQIHVGDHIRLSTGEEGIVTDITWRYTTIQTIAKNNVIVPNKIVASATITNYDMPTEELSITIPVGVAYDSDLDRVESLTLEIARQVTGWQEDSPFAQPIVRFTEFADSSINFNAILYLPRSADRVITRHEFIKALSRRYREEGINIPFPIRTIIDATR